MFANAQAGGLDLGFPDVCLVPSVPVPVPAPFPNLASGAMAAPAAYQVLMGLAPAHNLASVIPLSNGDQAGAVGGVVSAMMMGPARHLTGASTVLVAGMPITRVGSVSLQNSTNCPGVRLVPSQTTVVVLAP